MAHKYLNSSARQSPAVSPGPSPLHFHQSDAPTADVEVKVDALTKLQAELESGAEVRPRLPYQLNSDHLLKVPDAEGVISTLKACLKVSHQHLTTAAVSVIPPLLPLIIASGQQNHRPTHQRSLSNSTSTSSTTASIDAFNLRQALTAFLTPGGLFERLGDTREKPRDKARESLVLLGGYAFKFAGGSAFASKSTSSKGPETPLATFERFMKESGFGSKVWRIREQVCCTHPPKTSLLCARTSNAGLIFHKFTAGRVITHAGTNNHNGIADPPIVEYPRPGSHPSITPIIRPPIVSAIPSRRSRG